jgi:large conductance mechanosensitive channel
MLKEFKEFAMRGNVIDMAVGIIIGGAFGPIVQSLVKDILMPPIGLLMGGVDFTDLFVTLKQGIPTGPYRILADAQAAGAVTMNFGVFLNFVMSFLIIALAVFLFVKAINRMKREEQKIPPAEPTTKDCIYCHMTIPINAMKCGFCTSDLQKTA